MPTQWGGPPPARSTSYPSTPRSAPERTSNRLEEEAPSSVEALEPITEFMSDAEYEDSPMATLQFDFHEDREETSVASRAAMLAEKKELGPEDVYDLGEGDANRYMRYTLKVKLMDIVQNTVTDVDFSLRKMAELIPGRKTHFKVDPDDVIIAALSGSQSLPQLHGAWTVLTKRMAAALKFAEKYEKEYREKKVVISPGSTPDSVHDNLQKIEDGQSKLKYMVTNFPRHTKELTEEQRVALTENDNWEVLDTPNWMKSLLAEPEPEGASSAQGLQSTNPLDSLRGKSQQTNELGLREISDDEMDNEIRRKTRLKQKSRVSFGSPGPVIVQRALTPEEGLLGTGTPFKSQSGFLRGFNGERPPRLPPIRAPAVGTTVTPNPLFGMATPGVHLGSQGLGGDKLPIPETPSQPPRTTSWTSYQFSQDRNESTHSSAPRELPAVPPPTPVASQVIKRAQPSRSSSDTLSTPSSPDVPPFLPFGGG
ncbi:hypothetical protein CVT26_009914, partial [Gymnopilus dilepis]